MATKKERVYIRVTEAQKERLQKMAQKENRSLSNYILTVVESHINKEDNSMKKLVELNEGKRTELFEGSLEEIVAFLKENEDIYNWQLDEDPNVNQPELGDVEDWNSLEYELDRIDLSWWALTIE